MKTVKLKCKLLEMKCLPHQLILKEIELVQRHVILKRVTMKGIGNNLFIMLEDLRIAVLLPALFSFMHLDKLSRFFAVKSPWFSRASGHTGIFCL